MNTAKTWEFKSGKLPKTDEEKRLYTHSVCKLIYDAKRALAEYERKHGK